MTAQPIAAHNTVHDAWTLGHASGITWASWLGTPMQDHALTEVGRAREYAVYGRTLDYCLRDYFVTDLDRRWRRAFSSAVLLGWQQETDERPDAVECANCWLRVLTDVEESYSCPAGEHGTTCSEVCRDELCRLPRCGWDL